MANRTTARERPECRTLEYLSERISSFLANFQIGEAPREAIDLCQVAFIDTVGVMLAGSREHLFDIGEEMVRCEECKPVASIVGSRVRTSPQLAAFANGLSAHAMDYDFSFAIGQSAAPVIPSLLALAELTDASGLQLTEAFVAGCEVASRLARVVPRTSTRFGWHAAGTVGTISAAAACAKLLKLPPAAIIDAIGISASMAAGLGINYGTMTKPLHVAQAARNAITATALAARGFTSSIDALEGRTGFIELFDTANDWPSDAFDNLGRVWDLVERGVTVKLYPCGGLLHSGIEAALDVREGLDLSSIRHIHIGVTLLSGKRACRLDYPDSAERAKFSMPYVASYALVHGAPMLPAFTEQALDDDRVRHLAKLFSVSVDESFAATPNQGPARIQITLADGRVIEHVRQHASGTKQQPLSPSMLKAKFMSCTAEVLTAEASAALFARLDNFPSLKSLTDVWPLLGTQ